MLATLHLYEHRFQGSVGGFPNETLNVTLNDD